MAGCHPMAEHRRAAYRHRTRATTTNVDTLPQLTIFRAFAIRYWVTSLRYGEGHPVRRGASDAVYEELVTLIKRRSNLRGATAREALAIIRDEIPSDVDV